jgi:hypothetical protein
MVILKAMSYLGDKRRIGVLHIALLFRIITRNEESK